MSLESEVQRAGEARQVLESQVFIDARKYIDDTLAQLRRNVPIRETEMHTRLILMEQLWGNLLGFFEQLAQSGRMAEIKLAEEQRQRNLIERGLAVFRTTGRNAI